MSVDNKNDALLSVSHIARPSSSRSNTPSSSPSSRLVSNSRLGDQSRSPSALSLAGSNLPSQIAKPVSRTPKPTAIKPPSIVTKPSAMTIPSTTQKVSSLPPIVPPSNPSSVKTRSTSPSSNTTSLSTSVTSPHPSSPSSPSSITSHKNQPNTGIDSACYMTNSGSYESLIVSSPSSASSTPTIASAPTMEGLTSLSTAVGSETSVIEGNQRKPISRRPSDANPCVTSSEPMAPSTSPSTLKSVNLSSTSKVTTTITIPNEPSHPKNEELSPQDRRESISSSEATTLCTTSPEIKPHSTTGDSVVRCQCPPPLEFPENVKLEMKREELEHRQRESELYSKIIELQIENANLKGDKETLCRVVSHRDKMLMEVRVQLQAMEYFCRENDIKVDIEMCPDEVIQNWSFKESDEVYQRILITTQDLLRTASKCLEENTSRTSSRQRQRRRSNRSSSTNTTASARSYRSDASVGKDGVLVKETSRPGTLKLDIESLLRSEQELIGNKSTVNHSNLADINAGIIGDDGRRALDAGNHRPTFFRAGDEDGSSDDEDDGGDDSQESEFEELGEDMIKYVQLQPSMGPPRRKSRSPSFSRMTAMSPYCGSYVGTPDMSSSAMMKDYFTRFHTHDQASQATPVGLGLGIGMPSISRSPERISMDSFPAPPAVALPPIPTPQYSPRLPLSSYGARSPFSKCTSPGFISGSPLPMDGSKRNSVRSIRSTRSNCSVTRSTPTPPPPMIPLPPLPTYRTIQAKHELVESKRPSRSRISSQDHLLGRKTNGKLLARDLMHQGHQRRTSV
ncbi:hypothetical protein BGZ79_010439 [Entomortierella chlamydospora]|nr:hypothetical protein BGZ79_010439 [Entomortierella chlamydospora]